MARRLLKPEQLFIAAASGLVFVGAILLWISGADCPEVEVRPLATAKMPPAEAFTLLTEQDDVFPPQKDQLTDFILGGKNPTALIRELPQITGVRIADLEARMRQGPDHLLGEKESLLEVLAAQNQLVDELGLSHQELAKPLKVVAQAKSKYVRYRDRRYTVSFRRWNDYWSSPFNDGLKSGLTEVDVQNMENGRFIRFHILLPKLIERYGFYGGLEGRHRLDPHDVVEVFDFLKKR
jgi:hypothetical protein